MSSIFVFSLCGVLSGCAVQITYDLCFCSASATFIVLIAANFCFRVGIVGGKEVVNRTLCTSVVDKKINFGVLVWSKMVLLLISCLIWGRDGWLLFFVSYRHQGVGKFSSSHINF